MCFGGEAHENTRVREGGWVRCVATRRVVLTIRHGPFVVALFHAALQSTTELRNIFLDHGPPRGQIRKSGVELDEQKVICW